MSTKNTTLAGETPLSEFILETRGLTKEFKGFVAVSGVDLKVQKGHIHALIGPNGAGKTTVFNLLTKFLPPTSGTILFEGHDITREASAVTARRGMVRSFQISATFPNLSVLENVRIGLQRKLGTEFHFWRSVKSLDVLNDEAMALLGAFRFPFRNSERARQPTHGKNGTDQPRQETPPDRQEDRRSRLI